MKWQSILVISIFVLGSLIFFGINVNSNLKSETIYEDEEVLKCIIDNSVLYTADTCYKCKIQEEKLGKYAYLFNIIDCSKDLVSGTKYSECQSLHYSIYPIWMINGEKKIGNYNLYELKKISNC